MEADGYGEVSVRNGGRLETEKECVVGKGEEEGKSGSWIKDQKESLMRRI